MIKFEDFKLLESYIEDEKFQILLEKNLSSDINKDIKDTLKLLQNLKV